MNPTFEYYFQADPDISKPMYALYDVMDKHFVIQSQDYLVLYRLIESVRSKTNLEMVVMPYCKDITNANIEQYYIKNLHPKWFGDLVNFYKGNPQKHLDKWSIADPGMIIDLNHVEFDQYKSDLQKQLFCFYHFLEFVEKNPSELVERLIMNCIQHSKDYASVIDTLLNEIHIDSQQDRATFYKFLTHTSLFYE